jgi:hypothetical protein
MNFQKLIQSSFLNKNKKEKNIILNNGKNISVKSGDILHVLVDDEEGNSGIFKARFVDIEDSGYIWAYILNSNNDFLDIKIEQDRITDIERPN